MTKTKSKPLGRGLNTLLGSSTDTLTTDSLLDSVLGAPAIGTLPLAQIRPNKDQPRKDFDEERLEELAESIRSVSFSRSPSSLWGMVPTRSSLASVAGELPSVQDCKRSPSTSVRPTPLSVES